MARALSTKTNVIPPNSDYPYARARDNDGSANGTPVNENLFGDIIQFFEKMMADAGVTHNGLPDNDYSGFQYVQALDKFWRITRNVSGDLNDISETGFYFAVGATTNHPILENGYILNQVFDADNSSQFFISYINNRLFSRCKFSGTWGAWSELITGSLKSATVEIGDWNMDTTNFVDVPHGLSNFKKIRSIDVIIRNDADDAYFTLLGGANIAPGTEHFLKGSIGTIDSTNIRLNRSDVSVGGVFDSTNFNSTSFNRGWITIMYEP